MADGMFFERQPDAPVPIRDAATVLVLRDGDEGVEVLLLRRHGRSGFAADAWVFPGGVIDPADGLLPPERWRGLAPQARAQGFDRVPERVLATHVAAVRETFEEAGLLLATRADRAPADLEEPAARAMRARLADRDDPAGASEFAAWLAESDLVLDLGALAYWARWITPTWESRRYDTRFFLARAPEGQVAAFDEVETTGQRWITPQAALRAAAEGELHMIYPTIKNLEALRDACADGSIDAAFATAAAREVVTVLPHFERTEDGGWRILHPEDAGYPHERYAADLAR